MAKAQLFSSLMQDPFYNQIEIRKKFNEAIGMPELNAIVAPPPPTPQADLIFAQAESAKAQAKLAETQIKAAKTAADVQEKGDMIASEIRLKESTAVKNIAEAQAKLEGVSVNRAKAITESLYKHQDIKLRQQENDNRNNETSSSNS